MGYGGSKPGEKGADKKESVAQPDKASTQEATGTGALADAKGASPGAGDAGPAGGAIDGEMPATDASSGGEDGDIKQDMIDKFTEGVQKATLDDFMLLQTVGKGSFGKVVQVRKKDSGNIYAMKILKKDMVIRRKQYEHTLSERRILGYIRHPFIVALRYAFYSEHKLYMVFDFFNGGELYYYLSEGGRFGETRARFYSAEIALALNYLHKQGIVYRDLKPENLILDAEGHIRITDFGLSKEGVEGESITSICGTPEYLAPEILRKKPYGNGVDWWSLGTLLYEMIAGLPPFYDRNRQAMYRKILDAPLTQPRTMSADAFDLCTKLLQRDPSKRISGDDVLAHPFYSSLDLDKLMKKDVTPPWKPGVKGPEDTSRIAPEFTAENPAVTPSPMDSKLKDATGATPPSFGGFTFEGQSDMAQSAAAGGAGDAEADDRLAARRVSNLGATGAGGAPPMVDPRYDSSARRDEAAAVAAMGSALGGGGGGSGADPGRPVGPSGDGDELEGDDDAPKSL